MVGESLDGVRMKQSPRTPLLRPFDPHLSNGRSACKVGDGAALSHGHREPRGRKAVWPAGWMGKCPGSGAATALAFSLLGAPE